jgi:signal transduction histidine kinase
VNRWLQRIAVPGLLGVTALLAVALGLTAWGSYRAAQRAAEDVLFSRAAEVASSFSAHARLLDADAPGSLQQLVDELAGQTLGLAVITPEGEVLASSSRLAPARGTAVPLGFDLRRRLRLSQQAHDLIEDTRGQRLVHWSPLLVRPGPPRWRWWHKGPPDLRRMRRERRPRRGWRDRGPGGPPHRLLRVAIPYQSADALLAPARGAMVLALIAAPLLLAAGLLLHRAARRAQRAEVELRRREALSALGEMAAVMAHEIRTPLASIKGNAQLIGERLPADEGTRSIVEESARLERLVDGLLDYARPADPHRVPCDPDRLVARAAEIVLPRAQARGVALVTDPARCGPCLSADGDQLLQVLVNLLQNAIEASDGPRQDEPVAIRVRRSAGWVTFGVLDRGAGLAASGKELFRPFFSTKAQGTGLGLSIARQIVERHGGTLRLQPRADGGTEATVRLPERTEG